MGSRFPFFPIWICHWPGIIYWKDQSVHHWPCHFTLVISQVIMHLSCLWHLSTSLFELVQYHTELITVALSLVLKPGIENISVLQDCIGCSWPFAFPHTFWNPPVSFHRQDGILIGIVLNPQMCLGRWTSLYFIKFFSANFCSYQYKFFS